MSLELSPFSKHLYRELDTGKILSRESSNLYMEGMNYLSEEEEKYDEKKGMGCLETAANLFSGDASVELGHIYSKKKDSRSTAFFYKAARLGKSVLKYIAEAYRKGLGIRQDKKMAIKLVEIERKDRFKRFDPIAKKEILKQIEADLII